MPVLVDQDAPRDDLWTREHLTGHWRGLRTALENRGVTLSLEHEAETWGSYFGGLNRGTIYNGITTASLSMRHIEIVVNRFGNRAISCFVGVRIHQWV